MAKGKGKKNECQTDNHYTGSSVRCLPSHLWRQQYCSLKDAAASVGAGVGGRLRHADRATGALVI